MTLMRATTALRVIPRARALAPQRSLSCTAGRGGSVPKHHGAHDDDVPYDGPNGWLWGIPPGEKQEREGWEWPMAVAGVAFAIFVVALAFKPDTSLNTWALEEARRRLEKEGILKDPFPDAKLDEKEQ